MPTHSPSVRSHPTTAAPSGSALSNATRLTEMSGRDETVASLVARPAADEHALVVAALLDAVRVRGARVAEREQGRDGVRDGQSRKLHQLHTQQVIPQ